MGYGATIFLISACTAQVWPQAGRNLMKNGDFERWAGADPAGWETTSIPKVCVVVSADHYAHEGKLAAKLEAKECFGSVMPGMITQKEIRITPGQYQMKFWYKLSPIGGDVGYITMEFRNTEGSTIRVCEERLTQAKGSWVAFTGVFPAPNESAAADLRVALLAGKEGGSLHAGSSLSLDGMVLTVVAAEGGTVPPE
jgi:hypothetical protein